MAAAALVRELVASAPAGEIRSVVNDLRALHSGGLDWDPILRDYYHAHHWAVPVRGSATKVLLTADNYLGDDLYRDPRSRQLVRAPPSAATAEPVEPYDEPSTSQILHDALAGYVTEHYPADPVHMVLSNDDHSIILLVAHKDNPQSFWTGHWRSRYVYRDSTLSGSVHVDVHYYEDGNVRMRSTLELAPAVPADSIAAVVREIASFEQDFQDRLNGAFGELNEGIFKGLRRALPVTKQKLEWEKSAAYVVGPGRI